MKLPTLWGALLASVHPLSAPPQRAVIEHLACNLYRPAACTPCCRRHLSVHTMSRALPGQAVGAAITATTLHCALPVCRCKMMGSAFGRRASPAGLPRLQLDNLVGLPKVTVRQPLRRCPSRQTKRRQCVECRYGGAPIHMNAINCSREAGGEAGRPGAGPCLSVS